MTFADLLAVIIRLPDEALQPVADLALQLIQQAKEMPADLAHRQA